MDYAQRRFDVFKEFPLPWAALVATSALSLYIIAGEFMLVRLDAIAHTSDEVAYWRIAKPVGVVAVLMIFFWHLVFYSRNARWQRILSSVQNWAHSERSVASRLTATFLIVPIIWFATEVALSRWS